MNRLIKIATFGATLKAIRTEKKISKVAVHSTAGVAQERLRAYEDYGAMPRIDTLVKILGAYGKILIIVDCPHCPNDWRHQYTH
jgi:transcriptional regulator with XRE-family HTH domain